MENVFIVQGEKFLLNCIFDGLAHSYDVVSKEWVKPYPEVTGYIIKYFCDTRETLPNSIIEAADRLLLLQDKKTGGFASFSNEEVLYAFDTSQILIGLVAIYGKTGKDVYKRAAIKAGEFLLMMQQDNGAIVPAYKRKTNEKVVRQDIYSDWNGSWSGLMCKLTEGFESLYNLTNNNIYRKTKKKTSDFYVNAEYIDCTHPLGYWLEGLYEGGEKEKIESVLKEKVIPRLQNNGYISYRENLDYAYVSGVIQLGIIFYKMGYIEEALMIRNYARNVQSKHESGGLFQYADKSGCLDCHVHTEINSWGTKYFCELERLLIKEKGL